MSQKRGLDSDNGSAGNYAELAESESFEQVLDPIRVMLEARHARRERVIKCSRDITIHSKKVIFALHRITSVKADSDREALLTDAAEKLGEIRNIMASGLLKELDSAGARELYSKQYSPGLQEYVEAASMYYYLKDANLVALEVLQAELVFEVDLEPKVDTAPATPNALTTCIPLSAADYLLGVADLSGELMRLCINYLGGGNREQCFIIHDFLRSMLSSFEALPYGEIKELNRKINVMKQSLTKVENACYAVAIRGAEVPSHKLASLVKSSAIADPIPDED